MIQEYSTCLRMSLNLNYTYSWSKLNMVEYIHVTHPSHASTSRYPSPLSPLTSVDPSPKHPNNSRTRDSLPKPPSHSSLGIQFNTNPRYQSHTTNSLISAAHHAPKENVMTSPSSSTSALAPLVPPYLYDLSPTIHKWCALRCADIVALTTRGVYFEGLFVC